jgi:hypothetical protein
LNAHFFVLLRFNLFDALTRTDDDQENDAAQVALMGGFPRSHLARMPLAAASWTSTIIGSGAHVPPSPARPGKKSEPVVYEEDELVQFLAILVFYAASVLVLITVHEAGHYLAGRCAGIPARDMRIRLLRFPQHVELRDGGDWVSPVANIQRYIDVQWQRLKTIPRVYAYVSGGLLLETVFTVCLSVLLFAVDRPKIAFAVAGVSLLMFLPWLVIDGVSVCRGRISGDLSGLWFLARIPTLVLLVLLLATRGAIIWYALAHPT